MWKKYTVHWHSGSILWRTLQQNKSNYTHHVEVMHNVLSGLCQRNKKIVSVWCSIFSAILANNLNYRKAALRLLRHILLTFYIIITNSLESFVLEEKQIPNRPPPSQRQHGWMSSGKSGFPSSAVCSLLYRMTPRDKIPEVEIFQNHCKSGNLLTLLLGATKN